MRNALAVLLLATLLAACSGQPKVNNPNKSAEAAKADYTDCLAVAAMATALVPPGQDVDKIRDRKIDECMNAKGYDVAK